jgi:hypothetical protein
MREDKNKGLIDIGKTAGGYYCKVIYPCTTNLYTPNQTKPNQTNSKGQFIC